MIVAFSAESEAALESIGNYISGYNPPAAYRTVRALREEAAMIARMPTAYPLRADIAPGLRMAVHGKYLILFRIYENYIDIVRIMHGARDVSQTFNS